MESVGLFAVRYAGVIMIFFGVLALIIVLYVRILSLYEKRDCILLLLALVCLFLSLSPGIALEYLQNIKKPSAYVVGSVDIWCIIQA